MFAATIHVSSAVLRIGTVEHRGTDVKPSDPPQRSRYRFGGYVLDPATRELRSGGVLFALAPKAFDCIAYLIQHRDRAVGHDELTAAVWGRADVTDVQLRQLMRKVRRVVGDDGDRQAVIRTVAHFGFHWVAEVVEEDATRPLLPTAAAEASVPRSSRRRWPRIASWLVLILAIAAAIGVGVFWNRDLSPLSALKRTAGSSTAAIAVIPAEVEANGDADAAWMRLGLMDLVASRLRKAAFRVVPSSDIVALAGGAPQDGDFAAKVRQATGAQDIVTALAIQQQGGWLVKLTLHSGDRERLAKAYSPDVLLAARDACDQLLALLGKASPAPATDETAPSVAELLQRIEVAMLTDDIRTARRLIEAAPPAVVKLPSLQLDLARLETETDQDDAARARLANLLTTTSAADDPVLRARVLTALSTVNILDTPTAIRDLSEAIDLLEKLDDPSHLADALARRGIAYAVTGDQDAARDDFARARMMYTMANDSLGLASVDNNEAVQDLRNGRTAEALSLLERSAQTLERFEAINRLLTPTINQMSAQLTLLQPAKALAIYEKMRTKLARAESQESLRFLDYTGARSLAANGRLADARALLASVAAAADPKEEKDLLALIGGLSGQLDLAERRFDAALRRAGDAVRELPDSTRFAVDRAEAWLTSVRALRAAGQAEPASAQTQAFLAWATASNKPTVILRARLAEAEQHWSAGERSAALAIYEAAMSAVEHPGKPSEIRWIAESYADALLESGDLAHATAVVGRVGRWAASDFSCALLQARLYQALGRYEAWRIALDNTRALAGERAIPASIQSPPLAAGAR